MTLLADYAGVRKIERRTENLNHAMRIAEKMGDPREWSYTGEVLDLGKKGGECACGHGIRYAFIIERQRDNAKLMIGSVCIDSTVPGLIAGGAEFLAKSLQKAADEHKQALAEAKRREKAAKDSELVQEATADWDALVEWFVSLRQTWRRDVNRWLPQYLYYGITKEPKACSTPGRTLASIRTAYVGEVTAALRFWANQQYRGSCRPPRPKSQTLIDAVEKNIGSSSSLLEQWGVAK